MSCSLSASVNAKGFSVKPKLVYMLMVSVLLLLTINVKCVLMHFYILLAADLIFIYLFLKNDEVPLFL